MPHPLTHVLCIDDEADILEIVQLCLGDLGNLKVTCNADVELAIQRLKTANPDLIIIDMMMPKLNGMEAIRLIRAIEGFKDIPIILMTARVQHKEIEEYLMGGATGVIAKPFDPMTLLDQVLAIWNKGHAPD